MAPCWLYLVASFSHTLLIVHAKATDQWLLTTLEGLGANKLSSARAGPLSDHASLLTHAGRLTDPLSNSARPWPILNQANQFIIRLNG